MIKVKKLTKHFGSHKAVDKVTFDVNQGEVLGFLGPNGAGKTTTMQMITGFLTPTSGEVKIFDYELSKNVVDIQRLIGYVPEGAPLYGEMTVRQYLMFAAEIRGFSGPAKIIAMDKVVTALELEKVLSQPIDTLSKGFKRRVSLAQAMVHDPQILILDEPTDGLDPNQKHQVRELISNLSSDKIVIISTHILEEVDAVCSRAIIISSGKLVADDTPENLRKQSEFCDNLVIEVNKFHDDVISKIKKIKGVEEIYQDAACPNRFCIVNENAESVFKSLVKQIQENKWQVSGLYHEKGSLDDVFRRLTKSNIEEDVIHG